MLLPSIPCSCPLAHPDSPSPIIPPSPFLHLPRSFPVYDADNIAPARFFMLRKDEQLLDNSTAVAQLFPDVRGRC